MPNDHGRRPIRLILCDIDRTILPWGATRVSPRTHAAFLAAREAGIACGVASGRGVDWIPPFFDGDERCIETCVATNGNQVFLAGEKIREADMSGLLAPAASVARGVEHAGLIAFDGATPVLIEGTVEDLTAAFAAYGQTCTHDGHGRGVGSVTFPAAKASAFIAEPGEDGVLAPARESLTREYVALLNEKVEGLDFDYPQPGYSNVMPTGWSKATGVALLAERMGIGLDQVVVFGDAGNDLPMFEAVPNSVAVANATDEAAAAARWHIGRCEDDAVALAIEALVAGEWPFEE